MKSVLAGLGSSRGRVFVRRPSMKTLRLENSSQLNAEGHIEWGHDKPVGQAWAHRPLHLLGFSGLTRDFGETRVYVLVNGAYTLSVAKLWGIALCYWRLGQISTPTGTSLFMHQLCAVPALCTPCAFSIEYNVNSSCGLPEEGSRRWMAGGVGVVSSRLLECLHILCCGIQSCLWL